MKSKKSVLIEVVFDYDHDHPDDLMDVVEVNQVGSDLSHDEAHEQMGFLCSSDSWREKFSFAVLDALTGATTTFRSDEN